MIRFEWELEVHFVTRGCALGESCNYCHAEHTKRPVSLDKSQRSCRVSRCVVVVAASSCTVEAASWCRRLLGKVEEKYLLEIVALLVNVQNGSKCQAFI